jgi:signal transduction histidine kinase
VTARAARTRWAVDGALALAATGVEFALLNGESTAGVAANLITGFAGATLTLRRVVPIVVLAATLAAALAVVVIGDDPGGILVLFALYTTGAVCERRVSLAALAPTVVVIAGMSFATADAAGRETSAVGGAATAAVLALGVWGLGAYAQTRRRYARELEDRARRVKREREQRTQIAVHEQRASIARELHDIIAHSVSVMLVGVRGARDVLRTSPDVAFDTLGRVEATGEQSLVEVRRILALLRQPEQAAESGPLPSLADLDEMISGYREAGLPATLDIVGDPRSLPSGVELSVYRIVQEALTNALKHSQPTRAVVTLCFRSEQLEIEVVDDGPSPAESETPEGHGIVGMRERVALLGGQLEVGRRAGGGFRVAARLPIKEAE